MFSWIIVGVLSAACIIFVGGLIALRNFVKKYNGHDSGWASKNR